MSKVKVSVIVPVFNVGEYLSTSLDSILNQTLEDIEICLLYTSPSPRDTR